ncbi:MAG: hypothetical protein L0219_21205 [Phycisphaerales bacterium]|nr:hypothetical protein [Phycisphaerales bacterium]
MGFTVPPSPIKQALYSDLTDQVILFSHVDRKLIRYPHDDLDAIPEVFEIPGSVPVEGEVSLALSPGDGSIWMISSNFTAAFRMVFVDGGVEATAYPIPGIGSPPLSIDVDDARHLFLNIGGEAREFALNEVNQLVEVADSPFAGLPAGAMLKVTHSRSNYTDVGFDLPPGEPPIPGLSLPDCLADIEPTDGDGVVNVRDLLAVISDWGPCEACVADIAPAGGDGSVGVQELLAVIGEWGPCPELVTPLIVDTCASATLVSEGVHEFSTLQATTDGPPLPDTCEKGFGLSFNNDIWMLYVPTQTGTVTISTCNSADYDTRLAAYTGLCGAMTLIGCNDDGVGCAGFTSHLEIPVTVDVPVRIRLGGYGTAAGEGTVSITVP